MSTAFQNFAGKRILMLGWEFPPLHSGGLGVACYGLAKALREFIAVRFVVPKLSEKAVLEGVELVGLNQLETNIQITRPELERLEGSHPDLDYYLLPASAADGVRHNYLSLPSVERMPIAELMDEESVYGSRLMQKVAAYAEAVAEMYGDADYDLIHAHDWMTYLAGIRLKQLSGKPLVVHVHALETDRAGREVRNTIYYIERMGMQYADKVIAVSEYTKQSIINLYGLYEARIVAIHNGIDPQPVFRQEHHVPEKIVAFIGRLTHQKGPFYLLETAEKVIRQYPQVRFVVAGTGDKMKEMINWTAYKGLSRYFLFTGFINREKVEQLLAVADIYFMPSISEPFGLTALEAAQFGVPCVISKQSGVAELLKHAIKADYYDTDSFASAIVQLLQDDAYRKRVADQIGQQLNEMKWDDAALRVVRVYKSFLS